MIDDLIQRARRRFLLNETLGQSAFAAAVTVGGFALLLIVGTRFMEWWTLAVFAAVGIAIGLHRVYKRTPDSYTTAVRLDENARLHDTLSTALYFSGHQNGSPEFLRAQHAQAEEAAQTVHLEQAAPFVLPRSLYAMAALCLVASALIGVRFLTGNGLDLRAPITQFFLEDQAAKAAKKTPGALQKSQKQWTEEAQSLLAKLGMGPNNQPSPDDPDALDKAIQQALQTPNPSGKKDAATKDGQNQEGAASDDPQNGDPLDNGDQPPPDQSGPESKPGDKASKASSGKSANDGNRESLLSRLKDAVSDMLSNSDKDQNSSQKGQTSSKKGSLDAKGQTGKGEKQKGEGQAGSPDGEPNADGQDDQAQGTLNSHAETQPGQGGNGAGSQDGAKELREAAQLKAMGKINEIIGQRAATVSGETTIEVQSGNQKLRTAYSNTTAEHAETDGDVTRDEIPLELQAYVQQYFAEVRKAAPAKPKPASK